MDTLNFYSDSAKIRENNINAAKKFGVFELSMRIGEIYHRTNPVTKWKDRTDEEKLNIFSDYDCYGANCVTITIGGVKQHASNNPKGIHLKGCNVEIVPEDKKINFNHGDAFATPKFNKEELIELNSLIEEYGYSLGTSDSIFVNA